MLPILHIFVMVVYNPGSSTCAGMTVAGYAFAVVDALWMQPQLISRLGLLKVEQELETDWLVGRQEMMQAERHWRFENEK